MKTYGNYNLVLHVLHKNILVAVGPQCRKTNFCVFNPLGLIKTFP